MKKIFILLALSFVILTLNMNCSKRINKAAFESDKNNSKSKYLTLKDLRNGDLIFVGASEIELSGAINRVTKISNNTNFDHVGLIEKNSDSIFVLHATTNGGSKREKIHHFLNSPIKIKNLYVIYRLKKEFSASIPKAIKKSKTMLGKPYNWLYILNENEYYCSDFIERVFRDDKIFELIPMNFKNETGNIDHFWTEFYLKRGKSVPQDEPGTNPNQLASSKKLEYVGILKF